MSFRLLVNLWIYDDAIDRLRYLFCGKDRKFRKGLFWITSVNNFVLSHQVVFD